MGHFPSLVLARFLDIAVILSEGRMFVFIALSVLFLGLTQGFPNGSPSCSLRPGHGQLRGNWSDHIDVRIVQINQNMLINSDYRGEPNGNLVIIQTKNSYEKFKGIVCEIAQSGNGHERIQLPMLHNNRKLKKVDYCSPNVYITHKDSSAKTRVSFFFKHNLDYEANVKAAEESGNPEEIRAAKWFTCTFVTNYNDYYNGVTF